MVCAAFCFVPAQEGAVPRRRQKRAKKERRKGDMIVQSAPRHLVEEILETKQEDQDKEALGQRGALAAVWCSPCGADWS